MTRIFLALALWLCMLCSVSAQPLTALARLDPDRSQIADRWLGGTDVTLGLNVGVPFRVYTLDNPPRFVMDFSEVDFAGVSPADVLATPGRVHAVRFGPIAPGWSRLVADLAEPMLPTDVALSSGAGPATLSLRLVPAGAAEFAARAGAPPGAEWDKSQAPPQPGAVQIAPTADARFRVVLDPGHGGIDPGAEHGGLVEKQVVLDMARLLRDRLRRFGVDVVLTRDSDAFVSLEARTALAHQARASLFLSIHADALSEGGARGATVYTLSDQASDAISAQLAARHNRSDVLSGVDLAGTDDQVTSVLLDLARRETQPRSDALAQAMIDGMANAGGPMNRKPWRKAGFSVLKSADIPSVLIELGFLSSARDRENLSNPDWRVRMADGMAQAVLEWRDSDAARAALLRK